MQISGSPQYSWQQKALCVGVVAVAVIALGASLTEVTVLSGSLMNVAVLAAAMFVAILISRYELRVPGTHITLSPKEVAAFWGVMWLGIPGGILIGAAASAASNKLLPTDRFRLARNVALYVISIFCGGTVFYFVAGRFADGSSSVGFGQFSIPGHVVIASVAMALTHLVVRCALTVLVSRAESGAEASYRTLVSLPASTSVSLAATLFLFLAFNHFGIEFGLVLIPLAITVDLAFKFHLRSVEDQTKLISEASRIHLATVEALATAIDAREQVGIGHVRRTQIYAVGIGKILRLSEDEIDALRTGALLHDIGKLAVPDHILNKPGSLTRTEMEKIKTHAVVGASILEKVGFQYPVVPTVKFHHEFWDGSGYPEGLYGENIPLTARILAIADAYDTLRVTRPYRKAVPREQACAFLRARAGTQFDPRLVDIFLRNLQSFEAEIAAEHLWYPNDRDSASADCATDGAGHYVEQIKRANQEAFTLYSLARDFSSELDLDEILSLFIQKVKQLVPFDTSVVYLLDETNGHAIAAHADGRHSNLLQGRRLDIDEGATGQVLRQRIPSASVDPNLDFEYSNTELRGEYRSMTSLPLLADEKLVGAISLYSSELPAYQDEHLRLLETVSLIAADAILRSQEHAVTENYALTDPMTGLPNARSLQMHFEKEVKRADRNDGSFQLLVLDLDGFKAVNDSFGHKSGDRMLKDIASVIKGQLREYDFLARYGGDEFVAIVPDADSNDVMELAKRIEEAVHAFTLVVGEEQTATVGVSIGTACYPIHGETFDQIVISADKAMYLTKSFHKKRSRPSDPSMRGPVAIPEEVAEFATVKGTSQDGVILEIDETHIVSSSAIN